MFSRLSVTIQSEADALLEDEATGLLLFPVVESWFLTLGRVSMCAKGTQCAWCKECDIPVGLQWADVLEQVSITVPIPLIVI